MIKSIVNFSKKTFSSFLQPQEAVISTQEQSEPMEPMKEAVDILEAVKTYIETPDTKHAIMIDGGWGGGKTYLWENILLPEVGESEALYVSLFGLKDINDIENEIFKSLSIVGDDEGGNLTKILNSNAGIVEGVKVGGIGSAVQFGLKKWKEIVIKKSKRLFLCFDDLERWAGDIDICLSYINKLVEHEDAKCLVIGNVKELEGKNRKKFSAYKEKTIRFLYKLKYSPVTSIKASLDMVYYPSKECEKYIRELLHDNNARIYALLSSANCSNIRTISTAIHYLSIIYSKNSDKFILSPISSITYFESLLSTIILLDHHIEDEDQRRNILDMSSDGSSTYTELSNGENLDVDDETKLTQGQEEYNNLLARVFLSGDEIKSQGKFSIIKFGFYREEDFEEEFSEWRKSEDYSLYLDTFKFWYMEDKRASEIFESTIKSMFEEKSITDPATLLRMTDRLTSDIKRGVVEIDFKNTKDDIRALFDELYRENKMACVRDLNFHWGSESFIYCDDIYSEVIEQNKEYIEHNEKYELSRFWTKFKDNSCSLDKFLERLDDLTRKYKLYEIFSQYVNPEAIVEVIASLNNDQLFEFTRWMGSRITEKRNCLEEDKNEYKRALVVAEALDEKYGDQFGVKASHIKQVSRILQNRRTDYDPELIDIKRVKSII